MRHSMRWPHPWFDVTLHYRFRRMDFHPVPGVESVLLRLRRRAGPLVSSADRQVFRDFVCFAFTAAQPSVRHALRCCVGEQMAGALLRAACLEISTIPSMVSGTLWVLLFEHLKDAGGSRAMRVIAGAEQRLRRQQGGLQRCYRTRLSSRDERSLELPAHCLTGDVTSGRILPHRYW